jgi:CBS domain containing-hemolysin-like protein
MTTVLSGAAAYAGMLWLAQPVSAHASFLHGETLDAVADWIAIAVLVIAPIVGITVFWLVHILPEKIAEKKHHPQAKAIQTLCLLSLFFGGLLWPLAWLWAYTKPVLHKMAYGTDMHDPHAAPVEHGIVPDDKVRPLRQPLEGSAPGAVTAEEVQALRQEIAHLEARLNARSRTEWREVERS